MGSKNSLFLKNTEVDENESTPQNQLVEFGKQTRVSLGDLQAAVDKSKQISSNMRSGIKMSTQQSVEETALRSNDVLTELSTVVNGKNSKQQQKECPNLTNLLIEWNSAIRKAKKGTADDGVADAEISEFSDLHDSCLLLEAENTKLLNQISDNIAASQSCCSASSTTWGAIRHHQVVCSNHPLIHSFGANKFGSLIAASEPI